MLVKIPELLTPEQVRQCHQALLQADWADGRQTAGHLASRIKSNRQLPVGHPLGEQIGELILTALGQHPLFISAALPLKVLPPRFNRYESGGNYGNHVDNAILSIPGTPERVRTDISATLFLSPSEDYDGGELIVEDTYGTHQVKLPAGHLVLYPGTSLHRVAPVTRGARLASFFWIQSLVRQDAQRTMLLELDRAIQHLTQENAQNAAIDPLAGVYHNLLRMWSET